MAELLEISFEFIPQSLCRLGLLNDATVKPLLNQHPEALPVRVCLSSHLAEVVGQAL
jgi:hypothetical protein